MNELNKNYPKQHIDILSFRALAQGTITTYASYMTQFIEWTGSQLSAKSLADISWEELRSYFAYLKDIRKLNPQTINVHIAQLRDFYKYVLHINWDCYQIPFLHYDELLPKVPSKMEVNTLIDTVWNPKHKAELALLYSSGIRVSELSRLKSGDIYNSRQCIYISKSKNRSDRYAVLPQKAFAFLITYIRACHSDASKNDWIFPNQKQGTHIHPQSVYNTFKKQLTLQKLSDAGYTLHSLRHAFGRHLYEADTDIMTIKEVQGAQVSRNEFAYV